MKNQKGITLIALVITIIVLLILAGVAIAMLSGDNGILKNASDAAIENSIATAKEEALLEVNAAMIEHNNSKYVQNDESAVAITPINTRLAALATKLDADNNIKVVWEPTMEDKTVGEGEEATTEKVLVGGVFTITSEEKENYYEKLTIDEDGKIQEDSKRQDS